MTRVQSVPLPPPPRGINWLRPHAVEQDSEPTREKVGPAPSALPDRSPVGLGKAGCQLRSQRHPNWTRKPWPGPPVAADSARGCTPHLRGCPFTSKDGPHPHPVLHLRNRGYHRLCHNLCWGQREPGRPRGGLHSQGLKLKTTCPLPQEDVKPTPQGIPALLSPPPPLHKHLGLPSLRASHSEPFPPESGPRQRQPWAPPQASAHTYARSQAQDALPLSVPCLSRLGTQPCPQKPSPTLQMSPGWGSGFARSRDYRHSPSWPLPHPALSLPQVSANA